MKVFTQVLRATDIEGIVLIGDEAWVNGSKGDRHAGRDSKGFKGSIMFKVGRFLRFLG